jgi:hypothetical protein
MHGLFRLKAIKIIKSLKEKLVQEKEARVLVVEERSPNLKSI